MSFYHIPHVLHVLYIKKIMLLQKDVLFFMLGFISTLCKKRVAKVCHFAVSIFYSGIRQKGIILCLEIVSVPPNSYIRNKVSFSTGLDSAKKVSPPFFYIFAADTSVPFRKILRKGVNYL